MIMISNLHSMTKLSGWLRHWLNDKFFVPFQAYIKINGRDHVFSPLGIEAKPI